MNERTNEWTCSVITVMASSLSLIIYPPVGGGASWISVYPRDQRVVDSGVVSIFCQAIVGSSPPEIHWRRHGRRIPLHRPRFTIINTTRGSVLRIEPVKAKRDDGPFECRVENDAGEMLGSANATLDIYASAEEGIRQIIEHKNACICSGRYRT